MLNTIESVTAMRVSEGYKFTAVHEIRGGRHTLVFEDGRVSRITYCNKCGSAFSIGTDCVTCACSNGG